MLEQQITVNGHDNVLKHSDRKSEILYYAFSYIKYVPCATTEICTYVYCLLYYDKKNWEHKHHTKNVLYVEKNLRSTEHHKILSIFIVYLQIEPESLHSKSERVPTLLIYVIIHEGFSRWSWKFFTVYGRLLGVARRGDISKGLKKWNILNIKPVFKSDATWA